MRHSRLPNMLDDMLENPDELFVRSNSRHSALVSFRGGASFLIQGDFSGNQRECEQEARRVLRENKYNSRNRRIIRP